MVIGNVSYQPYVSNYNQQYQYKTNVNRQQNVNNNNSIFNSTRSTYATNPNNSTSIFQNQNRDKNNVYSTSSQQQDPSVLELLKSILDTVSGKQAANQTSQNAAASNTQNGTQTTAVKNNNVAQAKPVEENKDKRNTADKVLDPLGFTRNDDRRTVSKVFDPGHLF